MIYEFIRGKRETRSMPRIDESLFTPGKDYLDAFGKTCMDYGMTDVQEIISYYRNYIKKHDNQLDVSPQELGRQCAIDSGINDAMYDLDDEYFDKYMSAALDLGISDDFVMKYWDQTVKFSRKTSISPSDMASKAKREYIHSPDYAEKKVDVSQLDQIKKAAAEHQAPSVDLKVVRIDHIPTEDEMDELQTRYENGFYYIQKYERPGGGFIYNFIGNTNQSGENGKKNGENVRIIFSSGNAKNAFVKLVWPGFMDAADHLKSLESKAARAMSSEDQLKDKDGNVLKKWHDHKLTGYTSSSTGKWTDILEKDETDRISDFLKPIDENIIVDGQSADETGAVPDSKDDVYGGDFPAWALDYVVNHELGSVSRLEKQQIENWMAQMRREGYDTGIIDFDEEEYFSSNPEFGLPCDCVKFTISKSDVMKENVDFKNAGALKTGKGGFGSFDEWYHNRM